MTATHKGEVSLISKLGFGMGTLSYGIPFQIVSGFLVFYATVILGISGALTGLIISLSTVWDALTDPVMGYVSDHTSQKILFGRRLFYVFIGAIGLALFNYLLWAIDPSLPRGSKLLLLALCLIMSRTFSTVFATPYLALSAELSSDYNERTTIQSFRTAFFFLGFLFPSVIGMAVFFRPTPDFANGQYNPQAYQSLGLTASVIILACAAVCIALTYRHRGTATSHKIGRNPVIGLFKETAQALKCADFRNVSISLLFVNAAMGIVGAVGMHVFTYTFGFGNRQIAVVFGSLFLAALLAQPIWAYVAKKTEKRRALMMCLKINIAVSLVFGIAVLASEWLTDHYLLVLPLALLIGFSMGGSIALPYSMIADTIDKDAYYTGTRKEGVFFGCTTFMFKLSQALSVLFVGVLLDLIGFVTPQPEPIIIPEIDTIISEFDTIISEFDPAIIADAAKSHTQFIFLGMILPVGLFICFALALMFVNKYSLDHKQALRYQLRADNR